MTDEEAHMMQQLTDARTAMSILRSVSATREIQDLLHERIEELAKQFVEAVREDREKRFPKYG